MACERLTDEQRAEVERWHPYAMKCAMNWANYYCRLRPTDRDEFRSAGNDALIKAVREFKPELGEFKACLSIKIRGEMSKLLRRLYGGGLVGVCGRGAGIKTKSAPMFAIDFDELDERRMASVDGDTTDFDDAFEALGPAHQRALLAVMSGVTGVELAKNRGTSKSHENHKIRQAKAKFAQLMGVA